MVVYSISNTDVDGRTYAGHRDPPGQSSFYITPGDQWKENYRVSTFSRFPEHYPVSPTRLAASGFYYTGFVDRVKCFRFHYVGQDDITRCYRCGSRVRNWEKDDNPCDSKYHKQDCTMNRQRQQLKARLPVAQETSSIPDNVTQKTQNERYPCRAPINPHMESVINRLESFKPRTGSRWSSDKLRPTVDELVNAGFIYLGYEYEVKCFYCNGGLRDWKSDVDPWTEHAKWYPDCEFTLRHKGLEFVTDVTSQFPNLHRPIPPDGNTIPLIPPPGAHMVCPFPHRRNESSRSHGVKI